MQCNLTVQAIDEQEDQPLILFGDEIVRVHYQHRKENTKNNVSQNTIESPMGVRVDIYLVWQ